MKLQNFKNITWLLILLSLGCGSKTENQDITARAKAIHDRVLTVDTHCDTPLLMADTTWDVGVRHESGKRRSGKVDLPRMKEGGLDVEFFAAFVGQRERTAENYNWAQKRADQLIAYVKKMCQKYSATIRFAASPDEAYQNEKNGLLSAFIGMENGFPIGKDIKNIKRYYDMGVRYITLCHVSNNDICDSSTDSNGPEHNGLSEFGRRVVAEMNRMAMIVDVSHISDKSFFDVLEVSKAPVIASHSCGRALCDNPRNLTDDMLKALAANKGVIQICIFTDYVKKPKPNPERDKAIEELKAKFGPWEKVKDAQVRKHYRNEYHEIYDKYPRKKAAVKDVVDHIDHVVKLVGIDHVGIGTDFDGGGSVVGCDDVSEMPNITIELVKRGYTEEDIRKIWGGNFIRVFREVNKIAKEIAENR